jgi:hypothetical protein
MAETTPQNFANHTKYDPPFHFFVLPVLLSTVLLAMWGLAQSPTNFDRIWTLVLTVALLIAAFKIRIYALRVQDRVIRLEERLRLSSLLSEPLRSRINDLTTSQMVALRFAPDDELPELVEKALAGNLPNADIKKAILSWRPDHARI